MSAADASLLDRPQGSVRDEKREAPPPYLIETTESLKAVTEVWSELQANGSAFQSPAWLSTWYCMLAPSVGGRPLFVIVRSAETFRPLMFFPFCLRRRWGATVAEFPDLGVSDYNAPLCGEGVDLTDSQLAALWRQVRDAVPGADAFVFEKVPESLYGRPVSLARLDWLRPMALRCWTVELPRSRAAFDEVLLRTKDRKEHRRKRRNLTQQLGAPTLVEAASRAQSLEFFDTLKAMRAARFTGEGRRDILRERRYARFYAALIAQADPHFVSLSCVVAGDRTVAALMALRCANAYVLIMHSFAADLAPLSPGVVAIDQLINHLIEAGTRFCDFTTGNEPYKKQFGVRECGMRQGVDAVTLRGRMFREIYLALAALRAAGAKRLGGYVRALRRLRGRCGFWR